MDSRSVVTPAIAAEAAVWVARLHGPDRSPAMERECRAWQARGPAHRIAFERCTDTWQEVAGISLADAYAAAAQDASASAGRRPWQPGRAGWALAATVVIMVSLGGMLWQPWRDRGAYHTGVGEQRVVVLDDGTRMSLNTDTRVRVALDASNRNVGIERGEALFEVAKDPQRPFVVRASSSEVVAIGTVFAVRLTTADSRPQDTLTVTLIEGQVSVRATSGGGGLADGGVAPERPVSMQPGERVRLVKAAGSSTPGTRPQMDRPNLEQVVAWKRSEAVFDNVPLAEAVAEMNRYNRTPIVLSGAAATTDQRVSGQFRTGDSEGFARAVASLHGLVVHERSGRLEIAFPQ